VADLRQKYVNSWKNPINIIDTDRSCWFLCLTFSLHPTLAPLADAAISISIVNVSKET